MNILYPIAGAGSRFKVKGFKVPKVLVKVNNKTLLEHSISTLNLEGNYIFVTLKYDNESFNCEIDNIIRKLKPNSHIIRLETITTGAAVTCLAAESFINNESPLIITNGDQYLSWDSSKFISFIKHTDPDACVTVYPHEDVIKGQPSKYSFVKLNDKGNAVEFAEKYSISEIALNGIHYWKCGKYFVTSTKRMLLDDFRFSNEHYISGTFKYMIEDGMCINTYRMGKGQYYSLGSPNEILTNKKNIV